MSAGALEAAREVLARLVLDIPDHPEPGVVFKDITPVLSDPAGLAAVVAGLTTAGLDESGSSRVDAVVGMEARGFILAPPVALALGAGFVPVRKAGKLPRETHAVSYDLEYGSATLELHRDAVRPGDRVLLVDDVLATGRHRPRDGRARAGLRRRGRRGRRAHGPRLPALARCARGRRGHESADRRLTSTARH